MSTFHGLEMAKRALAAQQAALYTTGHNIANANTEGYSRQRVNLETLPSYPASSRNRPQIPGQLGQGVQVASVERIRDSFLDAQYRMENSKNGYWESMAHGMNRMESLFNEPSETGLSSTLDKFWQSLQDLAVHPDDEAVRSVVMQRGKTVSDTFNDLIGRMNRLQEDIEVQIDRELTNVNTILKDIDRLNQEIKSMEQIGSTPNDLYDKRDQLIDQLSKYVDIKVKHVDSGGNSAAGTSGLVQIELMQSNGQSLTIIEPGEAPAQFTYNGTIQINGQGTDLPSSSGSLKALVDLHSGDDSISISIETIVTTLGNMANRFNDVLNNIDNLDNNFSVIDEIRNTYKGLIADIGAVTQEANRMAENTSVLKSHVDTQRMSVSSVSLDEEMTNMIKFQHAYSAAARSMTAMDELLDRIINNMGVVGR